MLRRGRAMLPFFLMAWVLGLTQALATAHDRLQDEAAANSMSGTGNLDRGGNLSLATDLAIPSADDLLSEHDYFSTNRKGELSEIATVDLQNNQPSHDHVFAETESDAANHGLFDFSQHYRYDEDALEQPIFSSPDSDDFNSDLTKYVVPFVADEYPMASESEGDVEHALFTDLNNDPDVDFPEVFAYADLVTSPKENVSNTLVTEMGIGELGNEEFDSDNYTSGTYSETLGYDFALFLDLEKEGNDSLPPEDVVNGDLPGMHASFDCSVLTDINRELYEALSPAFKIASARNSPDLSGGHMLPSSVYDASIGPYGVFNLPIKNPGNPSHHSTVAPADKSTSEGGLTTVVSATTCGITDMTIKLFGGRLTDLKLRVAIILVEVSKIARRCRYTVLEKKGIVIFTTAFKGCNVKARGGQYVLTLMWRNHYVHMSCPVPTPDRPITICGKSSMTITLPAGPVEALRVKNKFNKWVSIYEVAVKCKYQLLSDSEGRITFTTSYNGCHVRRSVGRYFYNIYYQMAPGKLGQALMSCRTGINVTVPPEESLPSVFCAKSGMMIKLPKGSLNAVKVRDGSGKTIPVDSVAKNCNYQLFQMKTGHIILIASFQSCQIAFVNGNYVLAIIYTTYSGDFASVQIECPTSGEPTKPPPSTKPIPPTPVCGASSMMVELPEGPLEQVKIMNDSNGLWVAVKDVPKNCNYTLMKERGRNLFITSYKACHVWILDGNYILTLLYTTTAGKRGYVHMRCPTMAPTATNTNLTKTTRTSAGESNRRARRNAGDETKTMRCLCGDATRTTRRGSGDATRTTRRGSGDATRTTRRGSGDATKTTRTPGNATRTTRRGSGDATRTTRRGSGDATRTTRRGSGDATKTTRTPGNATRTTRRGSGDATRTTRRGSGGATRTTRRGSGGATRTTRRGSGGATRTTRRGSGDATKTTRTPGNATRTTRRGSGDATRTTRRGSGDATRTTRRGSGGATRTTRRGSGGATRTTRRGSGGATRTTRRGSGDATKTTRTPGNATRTTRRGSGGATRTTRRGSGGATRTTRRGSGGATRTTRRGSGGATRTTRRGSGGATRTTRRGSGDATKTTRTPGNATRTTRRGSGDATRTTRRGSGGATRTTRRGSGGATRTTRRGSGGATRTTRRGSGGATRTTRRGSGGATRTTRRGSGGATKTTRTPGNATRTTRRGSGDATRTTRRGSGDETRTTRRGSGGATRTTRRGSGGATRTTRRGSGDATRTTRRGSGDATRTTRRGSGGATRTTRRGSGDATRTTRRGSGDATRTPRTLTRKPTEKTETSAAEVTKAPTSVVCRASSMVLELPKEPLKRVLFLDKSNQWVAVIDAPEYCNYTLSQGIGRNFFITPYTACDVRILNKNYVLKLWYLTTGGEKGYVLMKCPTSAGEPTEAPTPTTTTRKPTEPVPIATTICRASTMMVVLPPGPLEEVLVIDQSNNLVPVNDAPKYCNYSLVEGEGRNIFITPYTTCDVKILNNSYVLTLHYTTTEGVFGYVGMKCPTSAALPTISPLPPFGVSVICSDTCMTVELPGGLLEDIQLMDESNNLVAVASAPKTCGYSLVRGNDKNILTAPYNACNVKILNNFYILRVLYTTLTGQHGDIHAKCPVPGLVPREGCKIPRSQQVACGPPNADPQLCVANGCCVDATTSQCYYPLDACTADGHFVFAVYRTSTKPEIDPGSLVISGNQSCAPVICTPDFAIFKFPVTGCGTHVFMVAETTIYLAEVHGMVQGTGQVYGEITRDSSYRLQVECRYSKGSLASTGYLVVNPPPPSATLAFGSLGVRLRIATDASYTTFHPLSHLPLSLLGSKVYLEVHLMNPPDPNVVLLVHYCIAYPQSSQAAWVILYEGCPNILDYSSAAGLHVEYDNMPVSKHTRRFEIQSFQFLDYKTKQHLDEDIYFMCSTEVCSPKRSVCNEGCFDGRDMPVPVDLGVGGRCAGKPCPGNVVKRAAHGEGTFILDENVPHEQTEKHWTHFHGLLGLLGLLVPVSVVILFLKKWVVWKLSDPGVAV
ncbi:uncharacterized protein LOC117407000 [Acipenser ruthenus]|uniref:uncharacterized protein LOC117407000 n=1 Tax=Acipenser ruthenus TaxID=7906 RepID=UPI00274075D9|nr:uncharacterized protein LOC117407000 [Acipenser ruthenus]